MKINYTKSYKNHFPEFDFNEEYYIIKINSKKFDNYWQNNSFLDESFPLDNMISNKNDVQSVLRQCIREKIKVLPSDFLTRNTINVINDTIVARRTID